MHRLKDPLVCEVAEATNQEIERTERWKFTILFHERFDSHIDKISGIVHDQNHLADGFQSYMTNMLDISVDLEVRANSRVIFVEGTWRNIWHQIFGKLHLSSDMTDDGPRNLVRSRK